MMDKEELTMVERKRIVEQGYDQIAERYADCGCAGAV